jgi:hypothetical protein
VANGIRESRYGAIGGELQPRNTGYFENAQRRRNKNVAEDLSESQRIITIKNNELRVWFLKPSHDDIAHEYLFYLDIQHEKSI